MTGEGDSEVRRRRTVLSGIAEYRREDVGVSVAPYEDLVLLVAPLTSLEWFSKPGLTLAALVVVSGSVFTERSGGLSCVPNRALTGLGFPLGDFARFALSTNQCLIAPSWFRN